MAPFRMKRRALEMTELLVLLTVYLLLVWIYPIKALTHTENSNNQISDSQVPGALLLKPILRISQKHDHRIIESMMKEWRSINSKLYSAYEGSLIAIDELTELNNGTPPLSLEFLNHIIDDDALIQPLSSLENIHNTCKSVPEQDRAVGIMGPFRRLDSGSLISVDDNNLMTCSPLYLVGNARNSKSKFGIHSMGFGQKQIMRSIARWISTIGWDSVFIVSSKYNRYSLDVDLLTLVFSVEYKIRISRIELLDLGPVISDDVLNQVVLNIKQSMTSIIILNCYDEQVAKILHQSYIYKIELTDYIWIVNLFPDVRGLARERMDGVTLPNEALSNIIIIDAVGGNLTQNQYEKLLLKSQEYKFLCNSTNIYSTITKNSITIENKDAESYEDVRRIVSEFYKYDRPNIPASSGAYSCIYYFARTMYCSDDNSLPGSRVPLVNRENFCRACNSVKSELQSYVYAPLYIYRFNTYGQLSNNYESPEPMHDLYNYEAQTNANEKSIWSDLSCGDDISFFDDQFTLQIIEPFQFVNSAGEVKNLVDGLCCTDGDTEFVRYLRTFPSIVESSATKSIRSVLRVLIAITTVLSLTTFLVLTINFFRRKDRIYILTSMMSVIGLFFEVMLSYALIGPDNRVACTGVSLFPAIGVFLIFTGQIINSIVLKWAFSINNFNKSVTRTVVSPILAIFSILLIILLSKHMIGGYHTDKSEPSRCRYECMEHLHSGKYLCRIILYSSEYLYAISMIAASGVMSLRYTIIYKIHGQRFTSALMAYGHFAFYTVYYFLIILNYKDYRTNLYLSFTLILIALSSVIAVYTCPVIEKPITKKIGIFKGVRSEDTAPSKNHIYVHTENYLLSASAFRIRSIIPGTANDEDALITRCRIRFYKFLSIVKGPERLYLISYYPKHHSCILRKIKETFFMNKDNYCLERVESVYSTGRFLSLTYCTLKERYDIRSNQKTVEVLASSFKKIHFVIRFLDDSDHVRFVKSMKVV